MKRTIDEQLSDAQRVLRDGRHDALAAAIAVARDRLRIQGALDGLDGQTRIEIGSILSTRTKQGCVELVLNTHKTQMDLDKAREVLGMLAGAIEAAVSDGLLFAFLTTKVGLAEAAAAAALLDFRELRQGSRSTVFPQ